MNQEVFEVEKKAYLKEPQNEIAKRLRSLYEAHDKGKSIKKDIYFTSKEVVEYLDLKNQQFIFRIRMLNDDFLLSLKEKSLEGNTEVNKELEVLVSKDNRENMKKFFLKIEKSLNEEDLDNIFLCDSKEKWINFLVKKGFYYLIYKEKLTRLYELVIHKQIVHVELNTIIDLGNFIEIEILCFHSTDIKLAVQTIDDLFHSLKIDPNLEEPKLYLELLFANQQS